MGKMMAKMVLAISKKRLPKPNHTSLSYIKLYNYLFSIIVFSFWEGRLCFLFLFLSTFFMEYLVVSPATQSGLIAYFFLLPAINLLLL